MSGLPTMVPPPAPLVSIVIPTFNRCAWLERAIDSVLAQDYPNLEVLVIDDGSSDHTPDILQRLERRHAGGRFRYRSQPQAGQSAAVNAGWLAARGEILGYLSDDDALAPAAVSKLVRAFRDHPEAVVVYPAYQILDERGQVVDTVMPIEYTPEASLRLHDTVIGPGALIRRSAIERTDGWDRSFRYMADLLLWMNIGMQGRAVRVPEVLAYWTRHAGAGTVQLTPAHAVEHLRVAKAGMELRGLPRLSTADRAETLRNACVHAAMFAGAGDAWPSRFAIIDFHRPLISGWSSRGDPRALPETASETLLLCRQLAAAIAGSGRAPAQPGGFAAAIGVLTDARLWPPDAAVPAQGAAALRTVLLEAAVACEPDIVIETARFAVFDEARGDPLAPGTSEFTRAMLFGFADSTRQLAGAVHRQRAFAARRR